MQDPSFWPLIVYVGVTASLFTLVRVWRRMTLAILALAAIAGLGLLTWSGLQGIWAEPGKLHFASPQVELAFRAGLALATVGTAIFVIGLAPPNPQWGRGGIKQFVADLLARMAALWVLCGCIGITLFTIITGYVK